MAKVSLVSLGCPKNLVDSENALGELIEAGHEIIVDSSDADVIIINTCGFIESAKAESLEAVEDALTFKETGNCKVIAVIGCLAQRYAEELAEDYSSIDLIMGINYTGSLADAINETLAGKRIIRRDESIEKWVESKTRVQATPPWTAYLKISDGCNNRCAYCAIPDIRGSYRSRPEGLILDEAKKLADKGVKELVLVGQDLTDYGSDYENPRNLARLLDQLNKIESLSWIRLMYCYPTKITKELIKVIASSEKVLKYIDLPLQHGDDGVLKRMNRRGRSDDYIRLVDDLRDACPEMAFRSSFIVGFPGEDAKAFKNLEKFIKRIDFDRVGMFTYSQEEGTPASEMPNLVSEEIAQSRYDKLMLVQQKISLKKNEAFIGKTMDVLVEGNFDDGMYGRSYRDAPEIDGLVYITGSEAKPGEIVTVTITQASEYDLVV